MLFLKNQWFWSCAGACVKVCFLSWHLWKHNSFARKIVMVWMWHRLHQPLESRFKWFSVAHGGTLGGFQLPKWGLPEGSRTLMAGPWVISCPCPLPVFLFVFWLQWGEEAPSHMVRPVTVSCSSSWDKQPRTGASETKQNTYSILLE